MLYKFGVYAYDFCETVHSAITWVGFMIYFFVEFPNLYTVVKMNSVRNNNKIVYLLLEEIIHEAIVVIVVLCDIINNENPKKRKRGIRYSMIGRMPDQISHRDRLFRGFDMDCMDRNTFGRLCVLLRNLGSLSDGKFVSVEEQMAMFLSVLSHHTKNSVVKFGFFQLGQTISHYVNIVLRVVLQLHPILLVNPFLSQMIVLIIAGSGLRYCLSFFVLQIVVCQFQPLSS